MRSVAGRRILVTGSTDGLGRVVAGELGARGADLVVHGRDRARVDAAARATGARDGLVADLSELAQVRSLAEQAGELDTLVNNAGVIVPERRESADGHELTFAVNHLAPFLLTLLVRPARVVNVSSLGQSPIDFDDVMLERGYDSYRAYAQSKLAQVMFTFDLAERGVVANALHPATLMDTKMVRETFGRSSSSVEEGAEATMALIEEDDDVTGRFYDGLAESAAHEQAYDPEARARLWKLSERLAGL